jgi:hypothetical protein
MNIEFVNKNDYSVFQKVSLKSLVITFYILFVLGFSVYASAQTSNDLNRISRVPVIAIQTIDPLPSLNVDIRVFPDIIKN